MNQDEALKYIHQSNLIEGIDSSKEDKQSLVAWNFLKKQSGIAPATLFTLHRLITQNQLAKHEAGYYRDVNVTVGNRLCPSPHLVPHLMNNYLLDFSKLLDPIEMHVRYEKIHPWVDGNGRSGRMLLWWHELKLGKKPTIILNNKKQEYYKWFK